MMLFVTYLSVLAVVAAFVSGTTFNVTNPLQDYYLLSQRQFQNEIEAASVRIKSIEQRGADRIEIIKGQQQVIVEEIQRTQKSFVPWISLSLLHKHCIQKYMYLLVSKDTIESQFTSCINTAQSRMSSVSGNAWNSLRLAKETVNTNLPRSISACNTTVNINNQTKMEECILYNVDQASKNVQYHMNTIANTLESIQCTITDISRQVIQCTFTAEKTALLNIGMVTGFIDRCVKEQEPICHCTNTLSTAAIDNEHLAMNLIMGANN